ncbi:MAG: polysaccharide export protein [Chlorobiaceae bacterium]|nr:polysaccharide export protein [Chlorobiaceae bacterium]
MNAKLFRFSIAGMTMLLCLGGCTAYRDLPAGTHQTINSKPEADTVREVIDISPNTSPATVPLKTNDYIIGANDVLYVSVNGKSEFTVSGASNAFKGYRVDGRGFIYLPLVGNVPVGGLSLSDARARIDQAMRQFYNNPWVVVEISEYRTRQVFVFGAVRKPGPFPLPASGANLAQVIASADLIDTAYNFKQVRIIRSNTPNQGELLVVDFDSVLRGKAMPMQMQEGDIVFIPKSAIGSWNEAIAELLPSLQSFSAILQPFVNIKYLKK